VVYWRDVLAPVGKTLAGVDKRPTQATMISNFLLFSLLVLTLHCGTRIALSVDILLRKERTMFHADRTMISLAGIVLTFWLAAAAPAADTPSGTVSLQSTSVAAGVGVQWGDGSLTYNGKKYPFSVQGLEVVGVGYAEIKAEGTVYNLTNLSDFEGVYASGEASAMAGSGAATVTMKNPNGVVISLRTLQEGAKLTLAAGGVNIALKK
jgi:hypothetical protein